ncbi:LuxR C-terminal-related transcriptional regulator [Agromyces aurantiacus]|uniref:LuxR C-terminal-related transcriptional regulator n=1 Tax=Agromyces aurantiacus TaxID=165814 RepID=A0ABV9R411_9MICO|nr:helix-turn-helix transcriptional regulator [Agromyces aurantiacus]MBM7503379.1 DNA-binding CsgD family transcriptional regulator [Agromyces aurantiacus]
MTEPRALDSGRAAARQRRWTDAYEALSRADATEDLEPTDLELLATVAFLQGEGEAAVNALTRAHAAWLEVRDAEGAARTAAWLALFQIELGELTANFEWMPRGARLARGITGASPVIGLVQVAPAVAQLASGDALGAEQRFRELGAMAERLQDHDLAALAWFGRGKSLLPLGHDTEGFACFDAAVAEVSSGAVSPIPSGIILCTVIWDAYFGFDLARAVEWTAVLDEWCLAQPDLVAYTGQRHALRAALLTLRGAWPEAGAESELALARLRAGDYRSGFSAPYVHAELQRLRGANHSAARSYQRAAETSWNPQPGRARLLLAEGRLEQAAAQIRAAAAAADPFTLRHLLPAVVEVEVAGGDLTAAQRALEELRTLGGPEPTAMCAASIAFAESQVRLAEGSGERALRSARQAEEVWRELDAPYEAARSRTLAGRALVALGDAPAAHAEFDRARRVFLGLGADPALAELDRVVGARRAGSLTARELEVLQLVSTGLTNRAVGERLSLSEKTVARHLANIFGKLGLSTRAAATAYAYENGLV